MKRTKTLALSFALIAVPIATSAEPAMRFSGRVEPSRTVVIANHLNGVVEDLHFTGGEEVAAGDLVAVIDPREYKIALRIAQAALAEADAALRFAEDDASRQSELLARGTGSRVAALRADIARDTAAAQRDRRWAEVDAARLALDRTGVKAPIGGTISPPFVIEGSYVEAKAGTKLAVIATLDPVRVAYHVSYAEREQALATSGAATPADMFANIDLTLTLPSGDTYAHKGRPLFESAAIDPETDRIVVWGVFPNPDRTLVPNLPVSVTAVFKTEARP